MNSKFTDQDRKKIDKKSEEMSKFSVGNIVTVEELDIDMHYAGEELVGVPLEIVEMFWLEKDVKTVESPRESDFFTEDGKGYRIKTLHYVVTNAADSGQERRVTEDMLIPWSEYDGKIHLQSKRRGRFKFLRDSTEPCPICGSHKRIIEGIDNEHLSIHNESCGVCGLDFAQSHSNNPNNH